MKIPHRNVHRSDTNGLGTKLVSLCFAAIGVLAAASPATHAAQITLASRDLQAVVEIVDFNPAAGDERADLKGNGTLTATYADTAQISNTQNDNSGDGAASMNVTLDVAGLKFGGSGAARHSATTNFDANDITQGAFLTGGAFSQYSVIFRIASSGKVVLSGNLQATGGGGHASVRVERWDGSGIALWQREVTNGGDTFSAEVPLPAGDYLVKVYAGSGSEVQNAGPKSSTGTANYSFSAQVVEAVTTKKPRK